jgi:hypothetical protein
MGRKFDKNMIENKWLTIPEGDSENHQGKLDRYTFRYIMQNTTYNYPNKNNMISSSVKVKSHNKNRDLANTVESLFRFLD